MIYPGMYQLKNASVFSEIEVELQSKIDSLGDLSQYNNCLDLPDGFNIDDEFSMETLQNVADSEDPPQTASRIVTVGRDDTEGGTPVNPLIKELSDLGVAKYLNYFNSVRGLGCTSPVGPVDFYVSDGFCGLHEKYNLQQYWVLSVSWTQSEGGFEYIYHEADNNVIKHSIANQGFNYRIYNCPSSEDGKLYQGRKASTNSFEWQIQLGKHVCQRVCQDWRGLRA